MDTVDSATQKATVSLAKLDGVVTHSIGKDGYSRVTTISYPNKLVRKSNHGLRTTTTTIHSPAGSRRRQVGEWLISRLENRPALFAVSMTAAFIALSVILFAPMVLIFTGLWNQNLTVVAAGLGLFIGGRILVIIKAVKNKKFPTFTFGSFCNLISFAFVLLGAWNHSIPMIVIAALTMIRIKLK